MLSKLTKILKLKKKKPPIVTINDLKENMYTQKLLQIVLFSISSKTRLAKEEIPLDWLLVKDLNLTYQEKSSVLFDVESHFNITIFDGIHCYEDFTTRYVLDYYTELNF